MRAFHAFRMAGRRDVFFEAGSRDQQHDGSLPAAQHFNGPAFERRETRFQLAAFVLDRAAGRIRHIDRRADRHRHPAERLRDLRRVPTRHRPVRIALTVERQDRVAGGACEPNSSWLRDSRRTARTIHCKRGRTPGRHVALQLNERLYPAARRRPARSPVPESPNNPSYPLAVEVLAGDDDEAPAPPEEGPRQDPAVPQAQDRLAAGSDDGVMVFEAVYDPAQRPSEQRNGWISDG